MYVYIMRYSVEIIRLRAFVLIWKRCNLTWKHEFITRNIVYKALPEIR